jgi:formylglycine-generating enzyme required for sulfatase activity
MSRRHVLLISGAALLLITLPCTLPREPVEEETCASQVQATGSKTHWYDTSTLIYVPPGEFDMGIPGGADNPEHRVLLDDFWIYKTEVTNAMYAACVSAGGCSIPGPDPSLPNYTDPELASNPVVGVTYAQSATYCAWVQGRLPTEAEWEKAARSTDGRTFPWGEQTPDCERANFDPCEDDKLNSVTDHPMGASPYEGLDFAGNASEWVLDWYKATYYTESPAQNPTGPTSGEFRSVRGGSFKSIADEIRTYTRSSDNPLVVRADLGFRCVVVDAQCFAPACEVTSSTGQPYRPRQAPSGEVTTCRPLPVNVTFASYCQKKTAYANVDPHGADVTWPAEVTCNREGDLFACTGEMETSFEVEGCTSCMPPTPEATIEQPSCPSGYTLDETGCVCRYISTVGRTTPLGTTCPSFSPALMMRYVPEQQCCEAPPSLRGVPSCDPGFVPYRACTCIGRVPTEVTEVTNCRKFTVTFPHCGPRENIPGCPEQSCQYPASWNSALCCCAIREKCQ